MWARKRMAKAHAWNCSARQIAKTQRRCYGPQAYVSVQRKGNTSTNNNAMQNANAMTLQRAQAHKKAVQQVSSRGRDWTIGDIASMNWNVSAGTEVQPSSSEIKRSAHIWGVSQRMPKETRQSKPRRQALRHHVKTLQVVQFKPNDIKLGRLQEPNKW